MAEITIQVDDTEVRRMLERAPGQLTEALRLGMEDATVLLLRVLQTYPPKRNSQTYKRTNTLLRSWSRRVDLVGGEVRGTVGSNSNAAPYNRLVQDRTMQAAVHRRRWLTVQDAAERHRGQLNSFFAQRVAQLTR